MGKPRAMRGVIMATFLYGVVIVYPAVRGC